MKLKELIRRIANSQAQALPHPDNLESYLEDFIPNTLLRSETLQKAFQVSFYEMEEIYCEAFNFYNADNYLESSTAFRWLVLLNPFIPKYWMGLAASLHLLEKYEKAMHAYAVAALLEQDNPYPHFHVHECYLALNNKEEAKMALQRAYQLTQGKDFHQGLHKEIEVRLQLKHDEKV